MVQIRVDRVQTAATMAVVTDSGQRYSLYSSPVGFDHQETARFGQVEREGMKPIVRNVGPSLATHSFSHRVYSLDPTQSIEHAVRELRRLARDGVRVRFAGGSVEFEQGRWWNTISLKFTADQRATDNRVSRFTLEWELQEANDVTAKIVKIVTPPPPKPAPPKPATRTHTVVRGDTLWDISARYLGNPVRWPEIFRLNQGQIRNPHWIYPGQKFAIPG